MSEYKSSGLNFSLLKASVESRFSIIRKLSLVLYIPQPIIGEIKPPLVPIIKYTVSEWNSSRSYPSSYTPSKVWLCKLLNDWRKNNISKLYLTLFAVNLFFPAPPLPKYTQSNLLQTGFLGLLQRPGLHVVAFMASIFRVGKSDSLNKVMRLGISTMP